MLCHCRNLTMLAAVEVVVVVLLLRLALVVVVVMCVLVLVLVGGEGMVVVVGRNVSASWKGFHDNVTAELKYSSKVTNHA